MPYSYYGYYIFMRAPPSPVRGADDRNRSEPQLYRIILRSSPRRRSAGIVPGSNERISFSDAPALTGYIGTWYTQTRRRA